MDKENVTHTPQAWILFIYEKKGNPTIWDNMDELWEHCVKEISHTEENKYCIIPLIFGIEISWLSEFVVTRGWLEAEGAERW